MSALLEREDNRRPASIEVRAIWGYPDYLPRYAVFLNDQETVGRYLDRREAETAAQDLRV